MMQHKRFLQKVAYSYPTFYLKNKKMADKKISMPSGMGGLVRYFDEYRSKIEIKPGHIVIMGILLVIVLALLHLWGGKLLGM